jgi:hypothetical protein
MLEASLNALHLALSKLGSTTRYQVRETYSEHAAEIGLIGSSAELAMAACLVHAHGPSIQKWPSGYYKAFPAILNEFRKLVRDARPISEFLVDGLEDPKAQREELLESCSHFRILGSVRAGGLHAGRGPTREAAIVQGNSVSEFLNCLAASSKIKPYLTNIPKCPFFDRDRMVIVEDLARRLNEASGVDQEAFLSSVFLVLPEVPDEMPEWIDALDRVSIAPRDNDISYLLNVIEGAVPATLKRTTGSGAAVPVKVDQDDPDALPIATRYLRTQFSQRRDQLHADIGTANGRLQDKFLDLPPVEAVREMFAVGLENAGLLEEEEQLTAHKSWLFVAASLDVQGTIGPYWFLIRKTGDLGQLAALLRSAVEIGGSRLARNAEECLYGIDAVREGNAIAKADDHFEDLIEDLRRTEVVKSGLNENHERHEGTSKGLPYELADRLEDVIQGSPPGPLIQALMTDSVSRDCKRYWVRVLCESALDIDDLPSLVEILSSDEASIAHTAARKAIRRIDFRIHGPSLAS